VTEKKRQKGTDREEEQRGEIEGKNHKEETEGDK
jgi:hypothetical protein